MSEREAVRRIEMEDKIYTLWNATRCEKLEVTSVQGKFNVYLARDYPAKIVMGNNILITPDFIKTFSKNEQLSLLLHERYHTFFSTKVKQLFNILIFFSFRKATWQEEFDADEYSAKSNGKAGVLAFLNKTKKLYKNQTILYNPKTHPSIDERIKRMMKMRGE